MSVLLVPSFFFLIYLGFALLVGAGWFSISEAVFDWLAWLLLVVLPFAGSQRYRREGCQIKELGMGILFLLRSWWMRQRVFVVGAVLVLLVPWNFKLFLMKISLLTLGQVYVFVNYFCYRVSATTLWWLGFASVLWFGVSLGFWDASLVWFVPALNLWIVWESLGERKVVGKSRLKSALAYRFSRLSHRLKGLCYAIGLAWSVVSFARIFLWYFPDLSWFDELWRSVSLFCFWSWSVVWIYLIAHQISSLLFKEYEYALSEEWKVLSWSLNGVLWNWYGLVLRRWLPWFVGSLLLLVGLFFSLRPQGLARYGLLALLSAILVLVMSMLVMALVPSSEDYYHHRQLFSEIFLGVLCLPFLGLFVLVLVVPQTWISMVAIGFIVPLTLAYWWTRQTLKEREEGEERVSSLRMQKTLLQRVPEGFVARLAQRRELESTPIHQKMRESLVLHKAPKLSLEDLLAKARQQDGLRSD